MIGEDESGQFTLTAAKHISKGDELCVDYDDSVGYERPDRGEHVRRFLHLCQRFGVEKRPSRLTMPPARIVVVEGTAACKNSSPDH